MTEDNPSVQKEPLPHVIGYLPTDPHIFLISAPDLTDPERPPVPMGRVLDRKQNKLFPPTPLISLFARMGWHDYTEDQSWLPEVLSQMEEVE